MHTDLNGLFSMWRRSKRAPFFEAFKRCAKSPSRPSLRSMAALAKPLKPRPNSTRGVGVSNRARVLSSVGSSIWIFPCKAAKAHLASPSVPLTYRSSPPCAPLLLSPCPMGTSPKTVMPMLKGPRVVSPPIKAQPWALAKAYKPLAKACNQSS